MMGILDEELYISMYVYANLTPYIVIFNLELTLHVLRSQHAPVAHVALANSRHVAASQHLLSHD